MRFLLFAVLGVSVLAQNPATDAVKSNYNRVKLNLIETAAVMPESDYSFKLSPAQRAFGEWIEHTATANYSSCSAMQGAPPPDAANQVRGLTKKVDLQAALKLSFDYCDEALNRMTDAKAMMEVTVGAHKLTPIAAMVGMVGGLNEHYGNLVGYMRAKGVVPPSSARAAKK